MPSTPTRAANTTRCWPSSASTRGDGGRGASGSWPVSQPTAESLIRQALIFRQAGENAKAIDLLKEALAAEPEHLNAQIQLGATYIDQGKTKLALDALLGASRQAPTSPVVHRLVALAYLQQGAFLAARGEAQEAVRLLPGDAISHTILGRILARQQNWKEAE